MALRAMLLFNANNYPDNYYVAPPLILSLNFVAKVIAAKAIAVARSLLNLRLTLVNPQVNETSNQ
jgi:hypothetical protein